MTARHTTVWYQQRPSADKLGNAPWVYGKLIGLEPPRRGLWAIIGGRK